MIGEKASRSLNTSSRSSPPVCDRKPSPIECFVAEMELLVKLAEEVEKITVTNIDRILGQQPAEIGEGCEEAKTQHSLLNGANESKYAIECILKRIRNSVERL